MAYSILIGTGVAYCVWGRPSIKDVDEVLHHVRKAAEHFGRPIVYITRVPVDAPAPEPAVRNHINSIMPEITEHCSSYHVVLEGTGFTAAIKRGVLVGLFQVGRRRNLFHVHASAADVLGHVAPDCENAVRTLLARADARGLLHGAPPTSIASPKPIPGRPKVSGVRDARELQPELDEVRFK